MRLVPVLAATLAATTATAQTRPVDPANSDTTAAACQDFYECANGCWLKANPILTDKARWGGFEELIERNRAVLKEGQRVRN